MKEENYVTFGFLWRIGLLDAEGLNGTIELENGLKGGKIILNRNTRTDDLYAKYYNSKVYFKESDTGRIILNKEEVKSWFKEFDLKYPKVLDSVD